MNNNNMYFRADGTFHILQVSDTQDLSTARKAMLIMLDCAYDKLKPDLVLFTGDNTLGNHLLDVLWSVIIIVESTNSPRNDKIRQREGEHNDV